MGGFIALCLVGFYFYNIFWLFGQSSINTGYDFISVIGVIAFPLGSIMGIIHLI